MPQSLALKWVWIEAVFRMLSCGKPVCLELDSGTMDAGGMQVTLAGGDNFPVVDFPHEVNVAQCRSV